MFSGEFQFFFQTPKYVLSSHAMFSKSTKVVLRLFALYCGQTHAHIIRIHTATIECPNVPNSEISKIRTFFVKFSQFYSHIYFVTNQRCGRPLSPLHTSKQTITNSISNWNLISILLGGQSFLINFIYFIFWILPRLCLSTKHFLGES